MAKSSVLMLEPRIKEAVDRAIREERATLDEIVAMIEQMGGEASRSAVGRYAKNAREKLEKFREAQQLASVWIERWPITALIGSTVPIRWGGPTTFSKSSAGPRLSSLTFATCESSRRQSTAASILCSMPWWSQTEMKSRRSRIILKTAVDDDVLAGDPCGQCV